MTYFISKQSKLPVAAYRYGSPDYLWVLFSYFSTLFLLCSIHTGFCSYLRLSAYGGLSAWTILHPGLHRAGSFWPFKSQVQSSLAIYAKKTIVSSFHLKFCIILFHYHIRVALYFFTLIYLLFVCVFPLEFGHSNKHLLRARHYFMCWKHIVNKTGKIPALIEPMF